MAGARKRAFTGFGVAMLGVLACALVFLLNFHTVVVSGHSMDPTLHNGEKLLVSKAYWLIGGIRHGDIIVMRDNNPDGYIIKRVYKMAGEKVDWNNVPKSWTLSRGEYTVPSGTVYVLGDNRDVSDDSRSFGPVDLTQVIGKVVKF